MTPSRLEQALYEGYTAPEDYEAQKEAVLALITSEDARDAMKTALHAAIDKAADPDAEYGDDEPWSVEEVAQAALAAFLNETVDE